MNTKSLRFLTTFLTGIVLLITSASRADDTAKTCFESRQGASEILQMMLPNGIANVKCSPETTGVLWWGDPFTETESINLAAVPGSSRTGEAVARPRTKHLKLYQFCGVSCHNGVYPPWPKDHNPRKLSMHQDIIPDSLNLQHGRGGIWCLDCHNERKRNTLVDNFGQPISFNEPQKLCGKCHGSIYRDWRDGIHGKRIGEWASEGKKRWFVCTECHNPHDVQQGARNSGFAQLEPELAPRLPKGLKNFDYELKDADGNWREGYGPDAESSHSAAE